jgi:CRP-like cAMP-binding protein
VATRISELSTSNVNSEEADLRTDKLGNPVRNLFLLSLTGDQYAGVGPGLEAVDLPLGLNLHDPGEKIDYAYFLNGGLCSLIVVTSEGSTVEVGLVGREGLVGTPLAVGMSRSPHRAVIQMATNGFRLRAEDMKQLAISQPELALSINRYAQIQGLLIAQTAACNRLHEVEQRMARWLLMSQDRIGSDVLTMTHEFLSQMLGTGRPSVSLAAGILQRAGFIDYSRGKMKILDRKGLEGAACECYAAMQQFNSDLGLS